MLLVKNLTLKAVPVPVSDSQNQKRAASAAPGCSCQSSGASTLLLGVLFWGSDCQTLDNVNIESCWWKQWVGSKSGFKPSVWLDGSVPCLLSSVKVRTCSSWHDFFEALVYASFMPIYWKLNMQPLSQDSCCRRMIASLQQAQNISNKRTCRSYLKAIPCHPCHGHTSQVATH